MKIGQKHVQLVTRWMPSAMIYTTSLGIFATYATDWKLVLQYVPYIRGKYQE